MPAPLLFLIGVIAVVVVVVGLLSGHVIAGSRGLKANYYSRQQEPLLYYSFLVFYSLIAIVVINHAL